MTGFLQQTPHSIKERFVAWLSVLTLPKLCGRHPGQKAATPASKPHPRFSSGVLEEQDVLGALGAECSPTRPLAYRFDFIEVYAGAAKVTSFVAQLGISVGPAIDLSFSEEYDLRHNHVLAWLTFLVTWF